VPLPQPGGPNKIKLNIVLSYYLQKYKNISALE
jgi:hypothetical protein